MSVHSVRVSVHQNNLSSNPQSVCAFTDNICTQCFYTKWHLALTNCQTQTGGWTAHWLFFSLLSNVKHQPPASEALKILKQWVLNVLRLYLCNTLHPPKKVKQCALHTFCPLRSSKAGSSSLIIYAFRYNKKTYFGLQEVHQPSLEKH